MSSSLQTLTIKNRWSAVCTAGSLALMLASFSQPIHAQDQVQQSSATASTGQAAPAPAPDNKEVRIGNLGFRVLSIKVNPPSGTLSTTSKAIITMRVHNYDGKPVAIDYNSRSASLVNERGYTWNTDNIATDEVSGIALATYNRAGLDSIIDPNGDIQFTIGLNHTLARGQTIGDQFDLQAAFATYEDQGEGKLKLLRTYSVSMLGLRKATIAEQIGSMPSDIGSAVKKSFGGLFK